MTLEITKNKKEPPYSIQIRTENTLYTSGAEISGVVYLKLLENFPGTHVVLKLKGREFVHWMVKAHKRKETANGGYVYYEDYDHIENKSPIVNVALPLHQWINNERQIPKGFYIFPFKVCIPEDLPGSYFQRGLRFLGDISYYVCAVVESYAKEVPRLKGKFKFILHEPIDDKLMPEKIMKKELSVCCSCFFCIRDKGTCKISYNIDKVEARAEEAIHFELDFDNKLGKVKVKQLEVCLKQKFKFKTEEQEKEIGYIIGEVKTPVIEKGTSTQFQWKFELPSGDDHETWGYRTVANLKGMTPTNKQFKNKVSSTSTKGQLISSEYFIEIKGNMDGICSLDPEITIPIYVRPPILKPEKVKLPDNMLPLLYETKLLCAKSKYFISAVGMNRRLERTSFDNVMITMEDYRKREKLNDRGPRTYIKMHDTETVIKKKKAKEEATTTAGVKKKLVKDEATSKSLNAYPVSNSKMISRGIF
jgi:hypothetical protein